MAISNLYPAEGPTLNLNFANSRILDRRITFTRTTGGTYTDRDGLIKYALSDGPRFNHQYVNGEVESLGLLIEEGSTNYFTQSIISNWGSSPAAGTKTGSAGISPDNTNTATLLEATATNSQTRIENGGQRTPGTTYTMSCFCKAGTVDYCTFGLYELTDGAKNFQAIFYLTGEGTVTYDVNCDATITPYTNGWYRCTMTITLTAGASYSGSGWKLGVCDSPTAYYNAQPGDNVYFWGAQLERKSFATSYIPTSGGEGDRGVDNAYIDGDNFSNWYNQTEGTVYCEFKCDSWNDANSVSNYNRVYVVSSNDGFENDSFWIANDPLADNTLRYRIKYAGTNVFGPQDAVRNFDVVKSAFAVKTNNVALVTNGNIDASSTNVLLPSIMKSIHIGSEPAGGGIHYLNGTISKLTYYPTRLSNNQLQNLTK